jgi:hypothetical protein
MDGKPRLAAMQASKSLASSSRTWFSTGINKTGFFDVITPVVLLSYFLPKDLNRIRTVLIWYLPQGSAVLQVQLATGCDTLGYWSGTDCLEVMRNLL